MVEILGAGTVADRRAHWALPLSVEVRRGAARVYGSGGYFSRGALFTAGALEWTTPAGSVVTGALTQSYSTSDLAPGVPAASRQRVDLTVGLAHPLSGAIAAWVAAGRSLTSVADGGTSLALSGGISIQLSRSATP